MPRTKVRQSVRFVFGMLVGAAVVAGTAAALYNAGVFNTSTTTEPNTTTTTTTTTVPEPTEPEWTLILEAGSGTSNGELMRLDQSSDSATAFSQQPERTAKRIPTQQLVRSWDQIFGNTPPRAVVTWEEGAELFSAAVELQPPTWENDRLVVPFERIGNEPFITLEDHEDAYLWGVLDDVRIFINGMNPTYQWGDTCAVDLDGMAYTFTVSMIGQLEPGDTTIDWGDGTTVTVTEETRAITHTYEQPGTYTVSVTGSCDSTTTAVILPGAQP